MNKSLWLLRLLSRAGKLTKQEILTAWQDEDSAGRPMAASTFYDNRRYLEERYGIRITQSGGLYSLEKPADGGHPVLNQLLRDGADDTQSRPEAALRGAHWIPLLLEAMQGGQCVKIMYEPYDKPAYETDFAPYCLTPRGSGCYTVGFSSYHGETRNFALDRIAGLTLLPTRFRRPAGFSAKEYFRHSFGAYGGNVQPERVEFAACPQAAAYLRQRPFHSSQRELGESEPARFAVEMAVTEDFVREVLSYGAEIEILAPAHLREMLNEKTRAAAEVYEQR